MPLSLSASSCKAQPGRLSVPSCTTPALAQHTEPDPSPRRWDHGKRRRGITCAVAGADLDARQQRIALRRVGAPGQHVLQRGRQLVAVQGHNPVVVVACVPHSVSKYCHIAPASLRAPHHASRAAGWAHQL